MDSAGKPKLLFVDDEKRVLNAMRAMFRRDYDVYLADSGQAALDLLAGTEVDVIISDQRMPGMTGVEVLGAARRSAPSAMRILLTGYADLQAIETAINDAEVFRYLMKPCPREELRDTVGLAVEAARQTRTLVAPVAMEPAPAVAPVEAAPAAAPSPAAPMVGAAVGAGVDLLVLSTDDQLTRAVVEAMGAQRDVHVARSLSDAVTLLGQHPIGVVVTDAAVDEAGVSALNAELKREVPQLVTIVASERSDAHVLIDLINFGQVFRFLLKPVATGQCRLALGAAVHRHTELVERPDVVRRYQVRQDPLSDTGASRAVAGLMSNVLSRLRGRFSRSGRVPA